MGPTTTARLSGRRQEGPERGCQGLAGVSPVAWWPNDKALGKVHYEGWQHACKVKCYGWRGQRLGSNVKGETRKDDEARAGRRQVRRQLGSLGDAGQGASKGRLEGADEGLAWDGPGLGAWAPWAWARRRQSRQGLMGKAWPGLGCLGCLGLGPARQR